MTTEQKAKPVCPKCGSGNVEWSGSTHFPWSITAQDWVWDQGGCERESGWCYDCEGEVGDFKFVPCTVEELAEMIADYGLEEEPPAAA